MEKMESRLGLIGRKLKIDGDIHTIYAISHPGVFAFSGEEKIVDEYGDVVSPVYVTAEQVEENLVDENLITKDEIIESMDRITDAIELIKNIEGEGMTQVRVALTDERIKLRRELIMRGEFG